MTIQPDEVERLIKRDQLDALLASLPLTLGANVFVSLSFCAMMWGDVAPGILVGWLALNAAINLARLWIARAVRRRGLLDTAPDRVLAHAWIGALVSGLCWAWALVACAQAGQAYNIATGLTFCGINAGAVVQSVTNRVSTLAFVLPNSAILIVIYLTSGSTQAQIMGVNLLLLTRLMVRASGRGERNYVAAARLRHEADHLAASLQRANVAATAALRQLDHAANHDPLTDLANRCAYRRAFEDRLARAARGIVVHGTHLPDDPDALARLARHRDRLCVAICPRTTQALSGRLPPVAAFRAAGLRVAIGTDGRGSNPDLSVLAECRTLVDAGLARPAEAIAMATVHGAWALGFERVAGILAPGRPADLVVLRPSQAHADPYAAVLDPATRVVATLRAGHVIAGRLD